VGDVEHHGADCFSRFYGEERDVQQRVAGAVVVEVDVLPLFEHEFEEVGEGQDSAEDAPFQPRLGAVDEHRALAEETGEALVALDDVQAFVHDHDAGGHGPEQRVRLLLRLVPHVDDAHLRLRPTKRQRGRELPAGGVAAPPAVHLVLRARLPDAAKGFFHVFLPHRGPLILKKDSVSGSVREVCVGFDAVAPEKPRLVPRAARSVDAPSKTGEALQEDGRAQPFGREPPKIAAQVLQPRDRDEAHLLVYSVRTDHVAHAPLDRVEESVAGGLGEEVILRPRNALLRRDRFVVQPAAQFPEGERGVDGLHRPVGLVLAGDAGADEDDGAFGIHAILEDAAVRLDRGGNRGEASQQLGEVALHVRHHAGTGGGEKEPRLSLRERLRKGFADLVRAERGLPHSGETEFLQRRHERAGVETGELAGPRRRHGGVHPAPRGDHPLHEGEIKPRLHCLEGADLHASAAGDAEFGNHGRLPPLHPDRLHRALADAAVAPLALLPERNDVGTNSRLVHSPSPPSGNSLRRISTTLSGVTRS